MSEFVSFNVLDADYINEKEKQVIGNKDIELEEIIPNKN